jgi:hypothetical protein
VKQQCRGRGKAANEAIALALSAVRALDIPHLEWDDEEGEVVH